MWSNANNYRILQLKSKQRADLESSGSEYQVTTRSHSLFYEEVYRRPLLIDRFFIIDHMALKIAYIGNSSRKSSKVKYLQEFLETPPSHVKHTSQRAQESAETLFYKSKQKNSRSCWRKRSTTTHQAGSISDNDGMVYQPASCGRGN
jgi:hypothetical protein